jgi:hypothetical protein
MTYQNLKEDNPQPYQGEGKWGEYPESRDLHRLSYKAKINALIILILGVVKCAAYAKLQVGISDLYLVELLRKTIFDIELTWLVLNASDRLT